MSKENPEGSPDKSPLLEAIFEREQKLSGGDRARLLERLDRAAESARKLSERTRRSLTPKELELLRRHRPELFPEDEEHAADAAEPETEPKSR